MLSEMIAAVDSVTSIWNLLQIQWSGQQCSNPGDHPQHSVCITGLLSLEVCHFEPLPGMAEQIHHFVKWDCCSNTEELDRLPETQCCSVSSC